MTEISFGELTEEQKLEAADLFQKKEAINGALAAIQSERALAEAKWRDTENFLRTELMKMEVEIRAIRPAVITKPA